MRKQRKQEHCLVCPAKELYCRGLCKRDYRAAARLVRENKTTWKKLEAARRAKPARINRDTAMRKLVMGS